MFHILLAELKAGARALTAEASLSEDRAAYQR
jgi:hypothetical protein